MIIYEGSLCGKVWIGLTSQTWQVPVFRLGGQVLMSNKHSDPCDHSAQNRVLAFRIPDSFLDSKVKALMWRKPSRTLEEESRKSEVFLILVWVYQEII